MLTCILVFLWEKPHLPSLVIPVFSADELLVGNKRYLPVLFVVVAMVTLWSIVIMAHALNHGRSVGLIVCE